MGRQLGYRLRYEEVYAEAYKDGFASGRHNTFEDVLAAVHNQRAYLGPLVVNEPNATVDHCVFFALDPNEAAIVMNDKSTGATVSNCTFYGEGIWDRSKP
jgi:hypothetical protein